MAELEKFLGLWDDYLGIQKRERLPMPPEDSMGELSLEDAAVVRKMCNDLSAIMTDYYNKTR
jgi:hypothetical protein